MSNGKSVCQITTVHPRFDTRIFHKECISLSRAGYQVSLIVNDGKGDESAFDIKIQDIGGHTSRFSRIFVALPKAFKAAYQQRADVYHFHDPELMLVGLALWACGKRVIYDSHEDLPNDIYNKVWIPAIIRKPLSNVVALLERLVANMFSAIVCSTPHIEKRFSGYGARAVLLRNYPERTHRETPSGTPDKDEFRLCYAGAISANRGLQEMVQVAEKTRTPLVLMGPVGNPELFDRLRESPAWEWVDYRGILDKSDVAKAYEQCSLGLAILHPDINYINALPIKLFEYMMFGLPVVCSKFSLWEEIVAQNDCGLCVDPLDIDEICEAVLKIKNAPEWASQLGKNGQTAVSEQYDWKIEFEKLDALYGALIPS